eukprot:gene1501-1634_t
MGCFVEVLVVTQKSSLSWVLERSPRLSLPSHSPLALVLPTLCHKRACCMEKETNWDHFLPRWDVESDPFDDLFSVHEDDDVTICTIAERSQSVEGSLVRDSRISPTKSSSATSAMIKRSRYVPLTGAARERRNARRRLVIRKVRLPKQDLRRNIPMMLMNVVNGYDRETIHSFFMRYCHPEISLIDFSPKVDIHDSSFSYITMIEGVEKITHYISSLYNFLPDVTFQLLQSEFRVRANGSCVIISKVLVSATLVCSPPTDDVHRKLKCLLDQGNTVVKESKRTLVGKGPQAEELDVVLHQCEDLPSYGRVRS